MAALFLVAVAMPSILAREAVDADPDPAYWSVMESVVDMAAEGRYQRARRVLGDYLAVAPSAPPVLLPRLPEASRASRDWSAVGRMMGGGGASAVWLSPATSSVEWGSMGAEPSWEEGLSHFRRGLTASAAGQSVVAEAALERAAEALPWMADWASYFMAAAVAPTGDTAAVGRRLEAAGPELAARGWRVEVQAARAAGDVPRARRVALAAARSATAPSVRAEAWVVLGGLRLLAGDTAGAREAYRSAMEGAPSAIAAVDAARGLTRLGPAPDDWRRIGSIYLRHGNQVRAVAGFEAYLSSGVGSPEERAWTRLQLGRAHLAAGRHTEAERRLLALADEAVPPRIAAEAMYQAGLAQYRQGRTREAKATFARTGERFPSADGTARALYLLADLQHDELELEAARANYRRAASSAPTLHEAGLALMRLGGLEYLAGNHNAAAAVFEEYRRFHPDGRRISNATYWAARSYLAAGREADASLRLREVRRRDPLSYHGIRAGEIKGQAALAIPMEASPPRREEADSLVEAALRRVDLLEQLGRPADAAFEVERLRGVFRRADGGDYALAEALSERGHTLTALSMGWDIFSREGAWNTRLLRIIYPFPFQELVRSTAAARGLDPYLVAAVIRRESAFNPAVSSSAGAIGLMQIMPQTGRGLARSAGLSAFEPGMLRQPELNVRLGVDYLASLMDQYGGDIPLVLSAYNAGPSRANRWRTLPEARDPELLMERVPFDETRDYVRHVKLNRALYRELYPDTDTPAGHAGS
jgi:soluble lytic murein transglycosylase